MREVAFVAVYSPESKLAKKNAKKIPPYNA
jgi:hypothetical protein